jgi:hypothetical protein
MFTMCAVARYDPEMVILAASAIAASLVPIAPGPATPQRQAQAMVTILASAELHFSEIEKSHPKILRETRVRGANGSMETVKLVEFQ